MARLKQAVTLEHRANTGEEARPIEFEPGAEIQVIEQWERHCLVKDAEGRLFNVPREMIDLESG